MNKIYKYPFDKKPSPWPDTSGGQQVLHLGSRDRAEYFSISEGVDTTGFTLVATLDEIAALNATRPPLNAISLEELRERFTLGLITAAEMKLDLGRRAYAERSRRVEEVTPVANELAIPYLLSRLRDATLLLNMISEAQQEAIENLYAQTGFSMPDELAGKFVVLKTQADALVVFGEQFAAIDVQQMPAIESAIAALEGEHLLEFDPTAEELWS